MRAAGRGRHPTIAGRWPVTAGFFNPVHPFTVQVMDAAGSAVPVRSPARLRKLGMAALIFAPGAAANAASWQKGGVSCLRTELPAHEVVYGLRRILATLQTQRTTVHGVLLRVHGVGVLLTGSSAVGKSEVALELVARGHCLIADDAVDIHRPAPCLLVGHCPPLLQGYLEVRGLGVLDVRRMYGAAAVRQRQRVDLVVRLAGAVRPLSASARLSGRRSVLRVLGESLPVRTLAARVGDNRAVLVEAACLDQVLRQSGLGADAVFASRQLEAIRRNTA